MSGLQRASSEPAHPALAVFASDKGPGSAERASIMSQAGSYFARKGARIICLEQGGLIPVPLITSARAAGGSVLIVSSDGFNPPRALSNVEVTPIADPEERLRHLGTLAQAFVGLPGSFATVSALYSAWVRAGGSDSRKPVVLLNRDNAFEVVRGFAADILSHSVNHSERLVQFTDTVEDAWTRISRLLSDPHVVG